MKRLEKYAPPGMDMRAFRNRVFLVCVLCLFVDALYGAIFIDDAIWELYDRRTGILLENVQLADFRTLWDGGALNTNLVFVFYLLFQAVELYSVFFRESRSIYTMARIRSPWELHIRCWTLPLLGTAFLAGSKILLRVILFMIYVLATPAGVPKPGFEELIGGLL